MGLQRGRLVVQSAKGELEESCTRRLCGMGLRREDGVRPVGRMTKKMAQIRWLQGFVRYGLTERDRAGKEGGERKYKIERLTRV